MTSTVVPGYVVDSRTMSWSFLTKGAIASQVDTMYVMSGSRFLLSGVGTAISSASHCAAAVKSVVAFRRPDAAARAIRDDGMCLMYDSPLRRAAVFFPSMSRPTTWKPFSVKQSRSGRPTYPSPTTPMTDCFFSIFERSVDVIVRSVFA